MNLNDANDHPVHVLNAYAADAYSAGDPTGHGRAYSTAATRLFGYEVENDVTFAALDNEALSAVREVYNRPEFSKFGDELTRLRDLELAVRDLLGLDD